MWVRCAYFVGTVAPENQEKFNTAVDTKARDKISSFPGLKGLRILRGRWREDGAPNVYQVIELTFDSEEGIAGALASKERAENLEIMGEIMPMFEGSVYHINYEVSATS